MQFFAMQDRTVRDLLGGIVDGGAHPPPKAVHRVDSEAKFGRPRASIHDDSSSAQNRRPVPAPTGSISLRRELQLVEMLSSVRHWYPSMQSAWFGQNLNPREEGDVPDFPSCQSPSPRHCVNDKIRG